VAGKPFQSRPADTVNRFRFIDARLGTLLLGAVPVGAFAAAAGALAGLSPFVCVPGALALGLASGALLARATTPAIPPADERGRRAFGVRALLARAAHDAGPGLQTVDLLVDVAPARLMAVGDPERVHRVMAVLIEHAAHRAPPGGVVTLAARAQASRVRVEIVPGRRDDAIVVELPAA
jgi:hypothetical protein